MKKILTVSLFAMMAVSAANAEIASTKYVDDAKSAAISAAATDATTKADAAKEAAIAAIPAVDSTFSDTSDNAATSKAIASYVSTRLGVLSGEQAGINNSIGELQKDILAINDETTGILAQAKADATSKDAALETKITNAYEAADAALETSLKSYADTAEADAIAAAKTAGDAAYDPKGSAAAAQSAAEKTASDALEAAKTELEGKITEANTAQANAITTAYEAADATTLSNAKTYAKEYADGLADNYDAAGSAAAAQTAAVEAAKTETTTQVNALANGAVKTNADNISTITTNLGGLNGIEIPDACTTGRCALVMNAGKAEWETINY